jgi:hypothetical protein
MENRDCRNLVAVEALYQLVREAALKRRIILTRKAFLLSHYPVTVTVDGLLALVLAGQRFRIDLQGPPPSNGNGPRRRGA